MLTYMPDAYPAVGNIMEVDMKKLLALMLCASLTFGGAVTVFAEETGEAASEVPDPAYAFTGVFDGNGFTVSNFTVNQPEDYALGLFGCTDQAVIADLRVSNAAVDGSMMSGAVVGYSHASLFRRGSADNVTVTGHAGGISNEGMFGGLIGASMESLLEDCSAEADIVIPDETGNAGVIGGGFELTSL